MQEINKMETKYKSGQWVLINNIWMEFIEYLSPTEELWTYEAGGKECNFHRHVYE